MADRTVTYRFKGDLSDLQAKLAAAGQQVSKFGHDLTGLDKNGAQMRANFSTVGDAAGKVGIAAAAGLGMAIKAAIDWESAWAGVTKTVDGSAAQMATLEGELRELAKTLPASHQEIAAVAEAAGQLGVQREGITAFTKTMIDLSETTNLTADEAATSIAQMANVMKTAPDEIDNLGASLVAVGNAGASTEAQIIQMSQGISGAAAVVGLAEADVLGIANAVASIGIEVEAGGSSISRVLTSMGKSVAEGGEMLGEFATTAGMTAEDFARAFEERPAEAFTAFIEGLGRIQESGGNVFGVLDRLGMEDVRVSRALLGMAADSEKFAGSLDLANQAWEENTALAIEAAKRYDTTAARTQVAWNNIKDAAIDFGDVALPAVAKVADGVARLAETIGALPGPVKSAGTSLLGITAVLGGGLWFTAKTVSGVASMREALTGLGVSSAGASKAMKGVAVAGAGLAALTVGAAAIRAINDELDETLPGMENLTRRMIDFASAPKGISSSMGKEFDSIVESVERISDPRFTDALQTPFKGLFGEAKSLREAKAEIESIDAALTNMVTSGAGDMAAEFLDRFTASMDPETAKAFIGQLDGYDEALAGVANDADLAAAGTDGLTDSTGALGDEAGRSAQEITDLIDAMREQRSAAIDAANAEIGYQAALDDARAALAENGRSLDITTEKGRENKRALLDVAAAWNQQSDAAKNAPGAHAAAIRSFVNLATQMGMGRKAAQQLARQILEIPSKRVSVTADTSQAKGAVYDLTRLLNSVDTNRIIQFRVTTTGSVPSNFTGAPTFRASGGPVYGPGTATSDSIPAYLSNGEYVVKAAAVAKYGTAMFDHLNAMRFASGGYVRGYAGGGEVDKMTATDFRGFNLAGGLGVREVRQELNEFRRAIREAGGDWTKQMRRLSLQAIRVTRAYDRQANRLEKSRERLADLRESRADLVAGARGSFANDPFGNGIAGLRLQLEADRNDSNAMRAALNKARSKGLDARGSRGGLFQALAQSGDLTTAQQLANASRSQIAQYERLYMQTTQAQNLLGASAGNAAFGTQIRNQSQLIQQQTRTLRNLDRRLNGIEAAVERGARRGTAQIAGKAAARKKAGR